MAKAKTKAKTKRDGKLKVSLDSRILACAKRLLLANETGSYDDEWSNLTSEVTKLGESTFATMTVTLSLKDLGTIMATVDDYCIDSDAVKKAAAQAIKGAK